jgi:hypothetical protein
MCQAFGFVLVRIGRLTQGGELLVLPLGFRFCALGVGLCFGKLVLEILNFYLKVPVFFFVLVCRSRYVNLWHVHFNNGKR